MTHLEKFVAPGWSFPVWDLPHFVIEVLGDVGDASTAAMLRQYIHDPDLGRHAVAAIRSIEARSS